MSEKVGGEKLLYCSFCGKSQHEVRKLVEEQAESFERPEEVVKWFYAEPERLRDIESAALEDNVVAWGLGVARVTDRTVDFDELMGKQ